MTRLILFDIDGTLISSGGAGEKSLGIAVRELYGPDATLEGVEIAGRTDTGIARQILERQRQEVTPEKVMELLRTYLGHLKGQLGQTAGRVLPGVPELLEALKAQPHVLLGLLTGNLAEGAELKLRHYGLWDYFSFGAYADDSHDRNQLGRFACDRASARLGSDIPCDRVYVLGDTPYDIECGNVINAVTVAVATGGASKEKLAAHQPDHLFADFSDVPAVLRALGV